ncbi:MAG: hotdog fold thioesterase, partial [Saprospiraceae bacterium]|nr:hotdog fold thioesterase [Saprospiraceae bacterium]
MHIEGDVKEKVQKFLNVSQKHMGDALDIDFTSFRKDEIKARMPVSEKTVQPFGMLHGGASVVLAETLASIGAWL